VTIEAFLPHPNPLLAEGKVEESTLAKKPLWEWRTGGFCIPGQIATAMRWNGIRINEDEILCFERYALLLRGYQMIEIPFSLWLNL
jgi:hypothetical protein